MSDRLTQIVLASSFDCGDWGGIGEKYEAEATWLLRCHVDFDVDITDLSELAEICP